MAASASRAGSWAWVCRLHLCTLGASRPLSEYVTVCQPGAVVLSEHMCERTCAHMAGAWGKGERH